MLKIEFRTVKSISRGLPDDVRSKRKLNALVKNAGDFLQFQKDGLLVSAWWEKKGRKPVLVVSTSTNPEAGPSTMQSKLKNGDIMDVPCVEPIRDYNAWMNAVDQIRATYSIARSSKQWWLYLFWFLFDLALANAFICFKESPNHARLTKENREKSATILAFKRAIVKDLRKPIEAKHANSILHTSQLQTYIFACKFMFTHPCPFCTNCCCCCHILFLLVAFFLALPSFFLALSFLFSTHHTSLRLHIA